MLKKDTKSLWSGKNHKIFSPNQIIDINFGGVPSGVMVNVLV